MCFAYLPAAARKEGASLPRLPAGGRWAVASTNHPSKLIARGGAHLRAKDSSFDIDPPVTPRAAKSARLKLGAASSIASSGRLLADMVAGQWEVWLTPCAKSITVPVTAAASLDELKEAVLNACMVATPELVPVSWLDASRIRQSMVLSARADAGDLTAIRFDDLRTLTPALQADVVPAEEAAALALLQAEEQRRQALVEAAALEALAFARANPLPPPLRSVPFLLRRTVPMYGIGIAWGAQYARARPLLPELGLPPWALWVAWVAGPVSGLVVQPLVGQLSDRTRGSSRCFAGKRRQWMWVGSLGLSASMLLMSSCADLGRALGDAGDGTHPAARVLALLAFCSAAAFLSVLQGPARTLVVDAAPPEQQARAPRP